MPWQIGDKVRPIFGRRRLGVIVRMHRKDRVLWSDSKELGWPDAVIADSGPDVIPPGSGHLDDCRECGMPFYRDNAKEIFCPNCAERNASGPLPAWVDEWWRDVGNAKYPQLDRPGRKE